MNSIKPNKISKYEKEIRNKKLETQKEEMIFKLCKYKPTS